MADDTMSCREIKQRHQHQQHTHTHTNLKPETLKKERKKVRVGELERLEMRGKECKLFVFCIYIKMFLKKII